MRIHLEAVAPPANFYVVRALVLAEPRQLWPSFYFGA